MTRRPGESGFTLLEILVVVTLIAGLAAFVLPALLGDNPGKAQRAEADRVGRMLTLASDYSLFRGQLVALALEAGRITPLVFNLEEQDFLPIDDQGLRTIDLAEPIQLEWELDTTQTTDEPSLAMAALSVRDKKQATSSQQGADEQSASKEDPQLFFFPSGEATSALLMIRHPDNPDTVRLQLDVMGRVTDPDASDEEEDDEVDDERR